MRVAVRAALLTLAASCGPPPPPAYITEAAGIASGPAAEDAMGKAPEIWKKASDALEKARHAFEAGDETKALSLAIEASILMKTAMAVARQMKARSRIASAEERIAVAGAALERFKSLRLDSESSFLVLQEFHDAQKDKAKILLASLEKDRKHLAGMSEKQKAGWLEAEQKRISRLLRGASGTILAARALGCDEIVPSETEETEEALRRAKEAEQAEWDVLRPLADDASLRAERLLVHTRTLHKPGPLANPASETALVERFVAAYAKTKVMVSATARGILLSIRDPRDAAGGDIASPATKAIEIALGAMGEPSSATVLVEVFVSQGCGPDGCAADSEEIAGLALDALVAGGVKASAVLAKGWGEAPPYEPGHCLAAPCPGGRLDVLIIDL